MMGASNAPPSPTGAPEPAPVLETMQLASPIGMQSPMEGGRLRLFEHAEGKRIATPAAARMKLQGVRFTPSL